MRYKKKETRPLYDLDCRKLLFVHCNVRSEALRTDAGKNRQMKAFLWKATRHGEINPSIQSHESTPQQPEDQHRQASAP